MAFSLWSLIPFALMLLSIAVMPLVAPKWWDRNPNKVILSAIISVPVLYVVIPQAPNLLTHSLMNYVSFLVLIGSLFVISGGIFLQGSFAGTPLVNTIFLALGSVASNLIGTTGASMILIRPYLRANGYRRQKTHLVVFFIFLVSNIGGLLTPLGDPPLFLGFLLGVPFQWTLRLIPVWAFGVGTLLAIFNLMDQYIFNKEEVESHCNLSEKMQPKQRLQVQGSLNFIYLIGVINAAMLSSYFGWPKGSQESIMIAMAVLSWFTTPRAIHEANQFEFEPIAEVAAVFLGLFITMIPTVEILNARALIWNFREPWEYFWLSGLFSSFLDSAPAYLTFTAMASGVVGGKAEDLTALVRSGLGGQLLRAISCGSVFMGAVTYIGNGPNFMVRSIAQRSGIKMPTFGGYFVYSAIILLPLFILVTAMFFR